MTAKEGKFPYLCTQFKTNKMVNSFLYDEEKPDQEIVNQNLMVKSLSIENFRCFQNSYFEDFGRVNLVGGKNNSGKTALLEALFLANSPSNSSISFLQQIRTEHTIIYSNQPALAWGNLFYNNEKSRTVKFHLGLSSKTTIEVEMVCNETPKSLDDIGQIGDDELIKVVDSETLAEVGISTIKLKSYRDNFTTESSISYDWSKEPIYREWPPVKPLIYVHFIPAGFRRSTPALANEFDRALTQVSKAILIDVFRAIDDSIEDVMTLNVGIPQIHIKRGEENWRPLNFLGDALNKITDIMLKIINHPNCMILIDEIENGIHWTNHEKFWTVLYKLASKFQVQIFATSHSGEMINAFKNVAIRENIQDAAYFEMIRSARSGEIVAEKLPLEVLDYNIKTHHPYRGE